LSPRSLLSAGDPEPAIIVNPQGASDILLLGDHAGRAVPAKLGDLGVRSQDMDQHIAWDIGVAGLGTRLSAALDATFIHQAYSRLVIDCNRRPDAADAAPAISDGVTIPANVELTYAQFVLRIAEIFHPYHAAIDAVLDARAARRTLVVSLHSFTPVMEGFVRPWRYGVLHRNDSALSRRVLALLQDALGEAAGDNAPYAMDGRDYTVPQHADPRGLDYLELEVRQDLIADEAGQVEAAAFIADVLTRATN
jgi:predicted N-formylglutamate amidohydrolase